MEQALATGTLVGLEGVWAATEPGPWTWQPTSGKKRAGFKEASLVCPHCQQDGRFVRRRGKRCESLLGPLRIRRFCYHCRGCHRGHVPWDHELGLGAATLTPAASEVTNIAGVQTSFAQPVEGTLQKLCGLHLSELTVERVTEPVGDRLANLIQEKVTFGEKKSWAWQRDVRGKTCAYVGLDATGARQQGEQGGKAEGRRAYAGIVLAQR
jgi:hypothetical protein